MQVLSKGGPRAFGKVLGGECQSQSVESRSGDGVLKSKGVLVDLLFDGSECESG